MFEFCHQNEELWKLKLVRPLYNILTFYFEENDISQEDHAIKKVQKFYIYIAKEYGN